MSPESIRAAKREARLEKRLAPPLLPREERPTSRPRAPEPSTIVAVETISFEQLCARCAAEAEAGGWLVVRRMLTISNLQGLNDCSECGRDLVALAGK